MSDAIDAFTERFFAWMDSEGLKPKDVAPDLRKKSQTVSNWRAGGIPISAQLACQVVMERYDAGLIGGDKQPQFVVKPTYEQFQDWNRAALGQKQLISEWAVEGLNAFAKKSAAKRLAVAEEVGTFDVEKKKKKKKKK